VEELVDSCGMQGQELFVLMADGLSVQDFGKYLNLEMLAH
jgi:hypothetical protein